MKRHLIFLSWLIIASILRCLPQWTVLNNPSSQTDAWIPIIGVWHLHSWHHAQVALGPLYFAPYTLAASIFGMTDHVIRYGQTLIFLATSTGAYLLLRRKLPFGITMLATVYLGLYAASPYNVGDTPFLIYEGCGYDFWPVALGQLAILVAILSSGTIAEILSIAGLLLGEALIKPNLAGMDAALICLAWWILKIRADWRIIALTGAALIGVFICLTSDDQWAALDMAKARLQDVLHNRATNFPNGCSVWGVGYLYTTGVIIIRDGLPFFAVPAVLAAIIFANRHPDNRGLLILGAVVATDLARALTNTVSMCWGFTSLVLLIAFQLYKHEPGTHESARKWLRLWCWTYPARYFLAWAVAFSYNISAPATLPEQPRAHERAVTINSANFSHILFLRGLIDPMNAMLNDGLKLLSDNNCTNETIASLDVVNPFPVLLGTKPPPNEPVFNDYRTTWDNDHLIAANVYFKGVGVIMVPKDPTGVENFEHLYAKYQTHLMIHYQFVAESAYWKLFKLNSSVLEHPDLD